MISISTPTCLPCKHCMNTNYWSNKTDAKIKKQVRQEGWLSLSEAWKGQVEIYSTWASSGGEARTQNRVAKISCFLEWQILTSLISCSNGRKTWAVSGKKTYQPLAELVKASLACPRCARFCPILSFWQLLWKERGSNSYGLLKPAVMFSDF